MRDFVWIILALLAVFVLPVVLLYGGAVFLVGGLFAWHMGDWTALLALAGIFLGGPLVLGLIVWNLFRRQEPALGNSRVRVSSPGSIFLTRLTNQSTDDRATTL